MQHGAKVDHNPLLMRKFNEGNEGALKEVYEYFKRDILYFTKKLIDDHQQSEEIIQDSFIKLFTRCSDFQTFSNIKYFLYTITRNACYDILQKNKVAASRLGVVVSLSEYGEAYNISGSASDVPSHATIQTELLIKIKTQVEKLPAECQKIFKMRHYDDKTVTEIANELGITKQSVNTQLNIAKGKIRRSIILLTLGLYIRAILHFFIK